MSKAILVIDMPSNCSECPCEYDYLHCKAYESLYKKRSSSPNYDEKPKWCPLKEMPNYLLSVDLNAKIGVQYANGWNTCLKEILGEENEQE